MWVVHTEFVRELERATHLSDAGRVAASMTVVIAYAKQFVEQVEKDVV